MIPRHLFFNWFGSNVPSYVNFAMENFHKVNPTFNCTLIHITPEQFVKDMEEESLIKKALVNLKEVHDGNKENFFFRIFNKKLRFYNESSNNNYQYLIIFCDLFRLILTNDFGGMYLDCDMFPVKPFDEKILNNKCFINDVDGYLRDSNFHGGEKGYLLDYSDCFIFYDKAPRANFNHNRAYCERKEKYNELSKKFYDLSLKYGEHFMSPHLSYIDHYYDGTWRTEEKTNEDVIMLNDIIKNYLEAK